MVGHSDTLLPLRLKKRESCLETVDGPHGPSASSTWLDVVDKHT